MDAISEIIEIDMQQLCRTCGNTELILIPIDEDLLQKVNKYLPIHIQKDDILPTQLCANCETAISLWHNFIVECSLQNQRFLEMIEESVEQEQADIINDNDYIPPNEDDEDVPENEDDADLAEENDVEYLEAEDEDLGHETGEMILGDVDDDEIEKEDAGRKIVEGSTQKKPWKCKFCSNELTSKSDLTVHTKMEHSTLIFQCDMCHELIDRTLLISHMTDHANEEINSYKAKADKQQLLVQEKGAIMEVNKRQNLFNCEICSKTFTSKNGLKYHLNQSHIKIKEFKCHACSKAFGCKRILQNHILSQHTTDAKYKCSICSKSFKTDTSLYIHKTIHNPLSLHCDKCDKEFTTVNYLKSHMKIHTTDKHFKCKTCSKAFKFKYNLTLHQRIHLTAAEFSCNLCNAKFKQKRYLSEHVKRLHWSSK